MVDNNVNEHRARMHIICRATYQIEKILEALEKAAADALEDGKDGFEFLVMSLTPRLQQLNSVIMSGAGDDTETAESLRSRMGS